MVIDTSAIIAILKNEKGAKELAAALVKAEVKLLSSVSYLEASMVLAGRDGAEAISDLDDLVESADIEIIPFDHEQSRLASQAFIRFGKGRHSAGLNFGDCAAYALASKHNLPLLFKGGDFSKTDIRPAINPNP
jgi:ribonuclease VapC